MYYGEKTQIAAYTASRHILRILAAQSGKSMVRFLHDLLLAEWRRVNGDQEIPPMSSDEDVPYDAH